jgi:hypothetical protein
MRGRLAALAHSRYWHKASFRGDDVSYIGILKSIKATHRYRAAGCRSLSDRSGHEPAGKTGCIGRE